MLRRQPVVRQNRDVAFAREPATNIAVEDAIGVLVSRDKASSVDVDNDRPALACRSIDVQPLPLVRAIPDIFMLLSGLSQIDLIPIDRESRSGSQH